MHPGTTRFLIVRVKWLESETGQSAVSSMILCYGAYVERLVYLYLISDRGTKLIVDGTPLRFSEQFDDRS
jgi:hypothetical protein